MPASLNCLPRKVFVPQQLAGWKAQQKQEKSYQKQVRQMTAKLLDLGITAAHTLTNSAAAG